MKADPRRPAPSPPGGEARTAALLLAALAALCLMLAVSFQIFDGDLWPQLARARALLALRQIPRQQMWTWPDYGAPERNATWGHALLLWPFWTAGGVFGLFVWRWLTVLAAFGLAWATARRIGARGLSVFAVIVGCAMVYRMRSQMRPETVALVLLALEVWILETRRHGGPDRSWWLVAVAWLWPSVHISYLLGLVVSLVFVADDLLARRSRPARRQRGKPQRAPASPATGSAPPAPSSARRRSLVVVLGVAGAASFLNPWGWSVLAFPFQYLFALREQGFDRMVVELGPVNWALNWRNGLPLLMLAWPALQAWRLGRGRFDRVEAVLWAAFTYEAVTHQRFLSFWAVIAVPYLARDLDEFARTRRLPAWMANPGARTATAAVACLALTALECSRVELPLGLSFRPGVYPIAACDFIEREGVRGRGFNYFEEGGYLLWRFWPDRERLPFITNAPELSSVEVRMSYWRATVYRHDWQLMDQRYRFDYALLKRKHHPNDHYLDFLDADSSFALVFLDDASALYVRRDGRLAPIARRFAYRWLSGGEQARIALGTVMTRDSAARGEMGAELERAIGSSPEHALTSDVLGSVLMLDGDWARAEGRLDEAHRLDPDLPGYFLRKGIIALSAGRPADAVRLLQTQRRLQETPDVDLRLASAVWAAEGPASAVASLERALRRYPQHRPLLDTLTVWRQRLPRSGGDGK